MYEYSCEMINDCTTDEFSFKGYLSRWMGDVMQLAPFTNATIFPKLKASAQAAAKQCVGGSSGSMCGMKWTMGTYDGTTGVGQQLSALETVQALLMPQDQAPLTNSTGGTSTGNTAAGDGSSSNTYGPGGQDPKPISTGDKVGAGFFTALLIVIVIACSYVMVT
jgi:mannan endo-1,6-alpha-mannosidase